MQSDLRDLFKAERKDDTHGVPRRLCARKSHLEERGLKTLPELLKDPQYVWCARAASPKMTGGDSYVPASKWANTVAKVDEDELIGLRGQARHRKLVKLQTEAVAAFRDSLTPKRIAQAKLELRGKTLLCWCLPDLPCHTDVLVGLFR